MMEEPRPHSKRTGIAATAAFGIPLAVGLCGLWTATRARQAAHRMESSEWINNDRCAARVAAMPDPGSSFRFAVFGDVQIGIAHLSRLMNALKERAPVDFIVHTGDAAAYPGPGNYVMLLNELERCGLTVPLFVVPGNHDIGRTGGTLFERYFGPRELSFVYGKTLFVVMDDAMGPFRKEAYERLENLLKHRPPDVRRVFLFMHRPPIDWEGSDKIVEAKYTPFHELLARYEIDRVFAGHIYAYHREVRGSTVFLVNGQGGDWTARHQLVSCSLTLVEVDGDTVRDERVELPPSGTAVAESLFKKFFIADIGRFMIEHPGLFFGILFLLAAGTVSSTVWTVRAGRRRNPDG